MLSRTLTPENSLRKTNLNQLFCVRWAFFGSLLVVHTVVQNGVNPCY